MPGSASLLYLSRADVAALLPGFRERIAIVERTYRSLAAGRVELPPKPGIHPRPDSFIHAMPAYLVDEDVAALKWVSGFPANRELGLPYISGLIVLNDPATGVPTAIMDGAEITAARTAAVSGLCVERFAPAGWRTAAIAGCGEQGRYHAALLQALCPGVELRAYDPLPGRAAALGHGSRACATLREAVEGADVIVTAAPIVQAPKPAVEAGWLAPQVLLLPVDFDALVQPAAIAACDLLLTDDVGQFDYYRGLGTFAGWPEPAGSVGAHLDGAGGRPARVACVNLGIGALDAAFAAAVAAAAQAAGAGARLPL